MSLIDKSRSINATCNTVAKHISFLRNFNPHLVIIHNITEIILCISLKILSQAPDNTLHSNDISLQCYSAEELFAIYHVDENDGFKMKRFESLSIALLDQIESNVCELEGNDDVAEDGDDIEKMTDMTGEQRL